MPSETNISRGVVKYESLFFFWEALRLLYQRAYVLSDLSYSPNLALTLMSALMREAGARASSAYASHRDSEKKRTAHT